MYKQKKVLLYLASNSPFYTNLYPSIKGGFEEAGCLVEGGHTLLESKELIKKIESFQPDFVFEMNRVKSEIENFPSGIAHICWVVDFWGRVHENFQGSDILYPWANDWVDKFKQASIENVYYLAPATDKTIYKPLSKQKKESELVFLGHISKEWTSSELTRVVGKSKSKNVYFTDLLPLVKKHVLTLKHTQPFLDSLFAAGIELNMPIDKTMLYDISSRSFRQIRREFYLDLFLKLDKEIAIYGSENWKLYERFQKFYKGYIESPSELNKAMQKASILLHDGNYPHFRTFDAMASGVVVAAAKAHAEYTHPWEVLDFKHNEDYINVDIYDENVDLSILNNKNKLKDIAHNAREKVLQKHLWVHRAEQVLTDFEQLKGSDNGRF
ncbi:glycosyltransferase [Sulfurimonas sp. NW7]|uniref:glycosyltransferase family protein n=1 Tax=Sulfurimonas sp. NW7 TaxID=2922727 RepID=UPI003DA7D5C5